MHPHTQYAWLGDDRIAYQVLGQGPPDRDELAGVGVRIRAGLHTGEVELRDDDVGGIAVHIAARVMAAAAPGEILTSRTVQDLISGSDIVLEDRGTHVLKGVAGPWQLYVVARP